MTTHEVFKKICYRCKRNYDTIHVNRHYCDLCLNLAKEDLRLMGIETDKIEKKKECKNCQHKKVCYFKGNVANYNFKDVFISTHDALDLLASRCGDFLRIEEVKSGAVTSKG